MEEAGKLVVISMSNRPGGTEQCLRMIAEAAEGEMIYIQKDKNHKTETESKLQPQFITSGSLRSGFLMLIRTLAPYRKGYTIFSSSVYLNGWLGILKRIGYLQSELIFRESTTIFSRFKGLKRLSYELLYYLGYPTASLIVCQTDAMRREFVKYNGFIPSDKVVTLHNPIDLETVIQKAQEGLDEEYGDFICSAGRLITVKGFDFLIKAFNNIAHEHKGLKLIILGDGPEKNNLVQLIRQLELEDRVILKGFVENPFPYFKAARLCVVSSIKEGFPNVLLQMMALNNDVVSTLCAGGIEDIKGIIKVKPGDIDALSEGMNARFKSVTNSRTALDRYLYHLSPANYINNLLSQFQLPFYSSKNS